MSHVPKESPIRGPSRAQPAPADATPTEIDAEDRADRELIAVLRSDPARAAGAWSMLLKRYQDRLYSVCVRTVGDREWAQDLCQDAMVKIIQGLESYDGRSKLSTWMIRVTMNVCLSGLRSEKHRRHASLDAIRERGGTVGGGAGGSIGRRFSGPHAGSTPAKGGAGGAGGLLGKVPAGLYEDRPEPPADQSVQAREMHVRVARALEHIDGDQRSLLVLRDVQGLEYEHIAEVLNVPVGTVKSRLFRARTALRDAMDELGNDAGADEGNEVR